MHNDNSSSYNTARTAELREAFRTVLRHQTETTMPKDTHDAIADALFGQPKHTPQTTRMRELPRWLRLPRQWHGLSVAAVVVLVIIVVAMPTFTPNTPEKQLQQEILLSTLIDENRVLENSLASSRQTQVALLTISSQHTSLDEIDRQIQQAYLLDATTEQKILLWELRKALLIKLIHARDSAHQQRIIVI